MKKSFLAIAMLTAIAVVLAVGCGSDGDSGSASGGGYGGVYGNKGGEGGTTSAETAGGAATVSAAKVSGLGTILVDASGHTLYDFHKDQGSTSACYGKCAGTWPPLLTDGSPKADSGAMATELGTTERDDGTVQVTYAGKPLYTYVLDEKPGQANGNDVDSFGAEWYALMPNGEEPED